jgi:hypothetical protein
MFCYVTLQYDVLLKYEFQDILEACIYIHFLNLECVLVPTIKNLN